MTEQCSDVSSLWALLVGIDGYSQQTLWRGRRLRNLRGCVSDVERMRCFLQERLGVAPERILTLKTGTEQRAPRESSHDRRPTYRNIAESCQSLLDRLDPGVQLLVHFSGHGGRIRPSGLRRKRSRDSLDECILPCDVGEEGGRCIRDYELGFWLYRLVQKGVFVTLILDCCHAGGAFRGATPEVIGRGVPWLDEPLPVDSAFGDLAEMEAAWEDAERASERNSLLRGGWQLSSSNTVFLAACLPAETAKEILLGHGEYAGVFTDALLAELQAQSSTAIWNKVHGRVAARVRREVFFQTPMIQGQGDRVAFAAGMPSSRGRVGVLDVKKEGAWIRLATGKAQGVGRGAEFVLLPSSGLVVEGVGLGGSAFALGKAEVRKAGVTSSWARVTADPSSDRAVRRGDWAELVDPGSEGRYRVVGLLPRSVSEVSQARLRRLLDEEAAGLLRLEEDAFGPCDFWVDCSAAEGWSVFDRSGELRLWRADGAVAGEAPRALGRALVHLARHLNLSQLQHPGDPGAYGPLTVEWEVGGPDSAGPDSAVSSSSSTAGSRGAVVTVGDRVRMVVKNRSGRLWYVVVLDLCTDGGCSQLFPRPGEGLAHPLVAGPPLVLPIQALPPAGRNLFKVFAVPEPVDFRWLQLPALDAEVVSPPVGRVERQGEGASGLGGVLGACWGVNASASRGRAVTEDHSEWSVDDVWLDIRERELSETP